MVVHVLLPLNSPYRHALQVVGMRWNEETQRWEGRMCNRRLQALKTALSDQASAVQTP